jgi:hypothetical protein
VKELKIMEMEPGIDRRETMKIINEFNLISMTIKEKFSEYVRHMKKLGDI